VTRRGDKGNAGGGTLIAEPRRLPQSLTRLTSPRGIELGDRVYAVRPLRNDGTYPHKEIGEILVHVGDVGYVREIAKFGGDTFYTVEFVERAVVLGTRFRDISIT
jgi:nitrogen fixation protein NifZ